MANVATFADVEQLLIDHLFPGFEDDDPEKPVVGTKIPNPRPDAFYRVQRTGGVRRTRFTDAPIVVLESWGSDEAEAIEMAETGRTAMANLQGESLEGATPDDIHQVYDVTESSGLINLPDPLSDQARYTQTFELHIRGVMP